MQPPSFDTSSYCKARGRLPDEFLVRVHEKIESHAEARVEGHHLWRGHRLKAIDGTSVKLMDTLENQRKYPQPSGQAKGCGFPVMGVVGVLDLARGTLSDFITCPYRQHDIKGFYELRKHFQPGDIAIGDRAFCSFEMLGLLRAGGVHSVMRLHQRRDAKRDWKSGKRLGDGSRLVNHRDINHRDRLSIEKPPVNHPFRIHPFRSSGSVARRLALSSGLSAPRTNRSARIPPAGTHFHHASPCTLPVPQTWSGL